MLNISLTGKVALVLGGSRGIGGAITRTLSDGGAAVIFTHTGNRKHKDTITQLVADIKKAGGYIRSAALNACDSDGTNGLINEIVDEFGKLDILVCNVGENIARSAEDVTNNQWNICIELNLSSAFYGIRASLPHMVRSHYGRIILIGSSAVYNGGGGAVDYAAAKAGLSGMMMYLAKEYTKKGILTNIIHPCLIATDLLRQRYSKQEDIEKLQVQVPVGRLGKPEDIAPLVAYLASTYGDFICGQSILVDGGRTLFGQKG